MFKNNKLTIWLISLFMFSIIIYFSIKIIYVEKNIKEKKILIALQSDASNGVFNPEIWKYKILTIIKNKINKIDFVLYRDDIKKIIIEIYDEAIKEIKKPQKDKSENSFKNFFDGIRNTSKSFAVSAFDKFLSNFKIHILSSITNKLEGNSTEIKNMINKNIEKYFKINDIKSVKQLIVSNSNLLKTKQELMFLQNKLNKYVLLFSISIIIFLIFNFSLFFTTSCSINQKYLLLNIQFTSLILLIIGILTSMIEINAKILDFNFTFLGETITFKDQILYFQRKSIIDVATVLIRNNPIVAVSVIMFSVIFPLFKSVLLLLGIFNEKIRNNRVIGGFIQNISKWSMADVFIVATFLSYLGFSGILNAQLSSITNFDSLKMLIDTNHTKLSIGFYAFMVYVILSIFIGIIYKKYSNNLLKRH